jgi:hypothetical protein
VNMTMSKRREVWQYWDTHYFTLNEYNPENNNNSTESQKTNNSDEDISVEDVPF